MSKFLTYLTCNYREAEDEKKQRAEIERRRKEEESLVAKYLEAERIKADEVSLIYIHCLCLRLNKSLIRGGVNHRQ